MGVLDYFHSKSKYVKNNLLGTYKELKTRIEDRVIDKGRLFYEEKLIKKISYGNNYLSVIFTPKAQKNYYRLDKDYKISFNNFTITVPEGFISDGASIPRNVMRFLPSEVTRSIILIPAIVHDYLYSNKGKIFYRTHEQEYNRKDADLVFKRFIEDYLKEHEEGHDIARICYAGVRIGGEKHFKVQIKPNI